MILATRSQALQLQQINQNPGLLPVNEGQAVISHDSWTIIKILNLDLIYEQLESNVNKYKSLKEEILSYFSNKTFDTDFTNVQLQTDYVMNITIEKYKQLIPSVRLRRGLINPLGSLIKTITGNLDNDDAIMYEKLITKLNSEQELIKKKVTIITELIGSFTNVVNSTTSNFIKIEKSIKNIYRELNKTNSHRISTKIIHFYNIFLHNFQTLYIHLNEIETAVAFSKIGLLHQSIVDTNEFMLILKKIEQTSKLVFIVNEENIVKIEQCIEIKAYIKRNQIKFIMNIPLIRNEIYNYYKLLPLPVIKNSQTTLIIPKYPYVLVKGLKIVSLSKSCREVDEEQFLCYESDVSPLTNDDCVADIMKFSTNITTCKQIPISLDNIKINHVQPNRWIIYASSETLLTKYCDNEVNQEVIYGTYLLTINDNCQVKIKEFNLKRHLIQGKDVVYTKQPMINLPRISNDTYVKLKKPLNLEEIDLTDIKMMNSLLQRSKSEVLSASDVISVKSILNAKSVSIVNIVILTLIVTLFILFIFKSKIIKYCKNCITREVQNHPKDNFELKEGEVMYPQPNASTVFISA